MQVEEAQPIQCAELNAQNAAQFQTRRLAAKHPRRNVKLSNNESSYGRG